MKGHGYSNDLLEACIRDAKAQGKEGICILCAEGRKREFLADPKFLAYKGFRVADISDCGINLMYLPIEPSAQMPKFRECAKHPAIEEIGFVLYYTDQCPYTYYWVSRVQEVAKEHGIPFKTVHITDKESAQNVPAPVTTYAYVGASCLIFLGTAIQYALIVQLAKRPNYKGFPGTVFPFLCILAEYLLLGC